MLKVLKHLKKKDWSLVIFSIAFICAQVWLDLKLPDYMSEITMLVQTEGSEMNDVLSAGGKMLLCALGSLVSAVVVAVMASKIAMNFGANLRGKLFAKVQSFSMQEIGNFSTASLITRSTNDVTQVQMFIVMGLQMLIKAPITAVWAIIKISDKSCQWTSSTAAAVVILLVIVGTCVALALPKFKIMQTLTDNLNKVTRENLTGLRVVRVYNGEEYQETKFEKANKDLTDTMLFTGKTLSTMMPGIQLVMNGLSLAIYWIGAYLIENAAMMDKINYFSDMVVFAQYAMQVVMSFMMLVVIFVMLPRASVAASRINEVLDTKPTIKDGEGATPDKDSKGEVEFRNVSFRYPDADEYVLKDITFSAKKGETVAFIGATGCGKSTVINLVPRFYDVTEGEVLVDGVDVRKYTQSELRNRIGYVSQKATLFTGSIKSNVAYGDNGKQGLLEQDVVDSVYTAQAAEFVEKMPEGYNGYVSQGGSNLSGGQKQRISIARAICRKPEILILTIHSQLWITEQTKHLEVPLTRIAKMQQNLS